ncbi:class I SAM-dependent methyltransferase [Nocardia sp. NPDC058633]|uniref:class I SAM-dependent methyltransferase n=1 Tax=Nocardia sp. NPDC058633 TaxID=3346568 RepID=UPI003653A88E
MNDSRISATGLPREEVPTAFDAAADDYDRLVAVNPGYHKHLRISARRMQLPDRGAGLRLLDAGCGTGASTAALLSVAPHAEIVAVDGSAQMLARARAKPWPDSVRFVHSRIEHIEAAGVVGPFDGIFAAYLMRNLADPDTQLRAFAALLRPGAPLGVHEYSVAESRWARIVWNTVCRTIIVPAGWMLSRDATLYRHLQRSVVSFDGTSRFRERLRDNGYTAVCSETVPGWQHGIVHTFLATPRRSHNPDGDEH